MALNPNFVEAVRRLYPGVDFAQDVIVKDNGDGQGQVLAAWNLAGAPPTDDEIAAAMAVAPVQVKEVTSRYAVARFTVVASVVGVTDDSVNIASVGRISAGRYRVFCPGLATRSLLPQAFVMDTAVRSIRATARTAAYVEVRVVDQTGTPADAAEVLACLDEVVTI